MRRGRALSATALIVLTVVLMVVGVVAASATPGWLSGDRASADWASLSFLPPVMAFTVVAGLVLWRRPGNAIGWLLGTIGCLFALVVASSSISGWALRTNSLPQSAGEWISIGTNAWVVALGLLGTQLPLRLPDGRLPSHGWRWFSRVTIALLTVALVGMSTQRDLVEGVPGTSNPIGADWGEPLAAAFLLVILAFGGGLAALVVRYRRASLHDRAQLRWVAFGGAVFLATYLVTLPFIGGDTTSSTVITAAAQLAFGALPVAIGYAVLRHNLYDIDVVINRALVYGALTAALAGAYVGSVLLLQFALDPLTERNDLAVAGSTLAVAALFGPARRRIQGFVDRRFYRSRYDAGQTLTAFSGRLREQLDLEALTTDLRGVVRDTVQPAHVSLWLRS